MRIRAPSDCDDTPRPPRPAERLSRLLLVLLLAALIVALAGTWYTLEGRERIQLARHTASTHAGNGLLALPAVRLDLATEEYRALHEQWRQVLQLDLPASSAQDTYPAQLSSPDEAVSAQVSVYGEGIDPAREQKWALQVTVLDGGTLLGMHTFSLRPPYAARCLDEWLYAKALRATGVLAPRYTFVRLAVNGEDWGAYAAIECPSAQLLESQGRQQSVVLSLRGSLFWRQRDVLDELSSTYWELFADPAALAPAAPLPAEAYTFKVLPTGTDAASQAQADTAQGLLRAFQDGQLLASQAFDPELMGRYLAHAALWEARHGSTWDDERYYYNPATSRLEPVGQETLAPVRGYERALGLAQYDDLSVMQAFAQEVERISHPAYLELLRGTYGEEIDRIRADLAQEYPLSDLALPWGRLAARQSSLAAALHPVETVHAYQSGSDGANGALELQVGNLLPYPVALHELQVGDRAVDLQPAWLAERDAALLHQEAAPAIVLRGAASRVPAYITLRVPAADVQKLLLEEPPSLSSTLTLITALVGMEDYVAAEVQRDYPFALPERVLPAVPSLAAALVRYPFLTVSGLPDTLEIKPGTWHVDGDLVLPDGVGLYATRSVTLTFDREAVFYATAPLHIRGTDGARISLLPQGESWAGLFVLRGESDEVSLLANVEVRGTRGIERGSWVAKAGITFCGSSVVLDRCRLSDSTARDMLHVMHAHIRLVDTAFATASGNAVAGQSVQGQIRRCTFHDIMGNAVDVSNSDLTVEDTEIARVYDRGISAGANSVVAIRDLRASDLGIAIASKDRSYVYAEDVEIGQAGMAGLAAYMGQMGYGPGRISASEVVFAEDQSTHALVQDGSSVTLNGAAAVAGDLDLDALSWRQETVPAARVLNYRLGPHIRLIGHDLQTAVRRPGEVVQFTLYWQALSRPPLSYTIFVHLLDASGQYVTGWDTMPRENTFPTTDWPVRRVIDDLHQLPLPPDLPPGEYQVALGMYDWETGVRLPVYDAFGDALPNATLVLERRVMVN